MYDHTLNALGHIVVEYQRDVFNVDTSARHVRSNEDIFTATFQHRQSKLTLFLTLASVKRNCIVLHMHTK